jgi:hypothetical protein
LWCKCDWKPFPTVIFRVWAEVLSMWPCKNIFTSKFSYLLFCNLTPKTETQTANKWGTTNSKPGPIRNTVQKLCLPLLSSFSSYSLEKGPKYKPQEIIMNKQEDATIYSFYMLMLIQILQKDYKTKQKDKCTNQTTCHCVLLPLKGKTNKLPSFKRQTNVTFTVGPSVNYLHN